MKLLTDATLAGLDGAPIKGPDGQSAVTVRDVCAQALIASYPDEQALTGDKKAERFMLAVRLQDDVVELKAEEVTLLKLLVGKCFGPLVVGPMYLLLDPPAAKPAASPET